MTVTIRQATDNDRRGIADTLVEAFYDQFKGLTTDKEGVAQGVAPMIDTGRFVVAVDEAGTVVGTAALSDQQGYAITVQASVLRKALGLVKGNLAAIALKEEFHRPATFQPGQAQVDFVAVRESARGERLATRLLEHLLQRGGYMLYTLDVVEGNEHVLPLYQSLGFEVTAKETEKHARMKGFSFRYVMARRVEA